MYYITYFVHNYIMNVKIISIIHDSIKLRCKLIVFNYMSNNQRVAIFCAHVFGKVSFILRMNEMKKKTNIKEQMTNK